MTNPDNAIGTNAAYGTRTSVNAFNDICQLTNGRGIVSGWACSPKSGMVVQLGGVAGTRDVAIAEDNLGNRTTINNRLGEPIEVEIGAASTSANRYDAIVAYVKNPAQATAETPIPQDAPSVCGFIVVEGSSTGVSEAQIRTAITADGGGGTTAYYVVLATVFVAQSTTTITSTNISQYHSSIGSQMLDKVEIYSYDQATTTTSTVTLDIPINLGAFRKIIITGAMESITSAITDVCAVEAWGNGSRAATDQCGIEFWNNPGAFLARSDIALVACGARPYDSVGFEVEIYSLRTGSWPTFRSYAMGGDSINGFTSQTFNGRIREGADIIDTIRVQFPQPQAGAWVRAYGVKDV